MENRASDMQEEWTRLEHGVIPEGQFIVTSLIQNSDGTKVVLDDEKNVVEIVFDGIPSLVRITTEGIRMRTWSEVQLKYQNKFFFQNWFFYQVQNSKLSKWAKEESCNFYEEEQLKHYCIVTSEEVIDILAAFKPIVKVSKI
ncbi:hypothetical protein [Ferviditalea candida]|uniref:Uncharacterized protein n=1 Tax=Ferviditalea candida TaxID=3108399 RepID=A0ABU5ZNI6_9BACL|nr:hypothetical protein [Paenibacillaceae bacterium T2]